MTTIRHPLQGMEEAVVISNLKLFKAEFHGHYLGGYAFILASNKTEALLLLADKIEEMGLMDKNPEEPQLTEVSMFTKEAHILWDGNY